jgi:exopolyphosphatase/guanosine-5'-triphosphate,3'-diphosphate pyrophosphatase
MLNYNRIAAIDIGSNAIRLLIANVIEAEEGPLFKKSSLIRVPIRLGMDVFNNGKISEENIERMRHAMSAFKHLMFVNGVVDYSACATSAMRESANGEEVINYLLEETGVRIQMIDGKEEADIIYKTQIAEHLDPEISHLYVDVGGGSTELTYFHQGVPSSSRSFKIGTIRILAEKVANEEWIEMKQWIKDRQKVYGNVDVIGSGGNINKLFKMSGKKIGKPLDLGELSRMYKHIEGYSWEERVTKLDLNVDRADVIVPALQIFLKVMKASHAQKVYVPKIGLSDGIVRTIYGRLERQTPRF